MLRAKPGNGVVPDLGDGGGATQDDREPFRSTGAREVAEVAHIFLQHVAVEEDHGAQGLVLRGGRHAPLRGQVGQELPDFRRAHV